MNAKSLMIMVLGAGLLWGGVRLLNSEDQGPATGGSKQDRLLPGLQKQVNHVRGLSLQGPGGSLQFDRSEEGQWTLRDRSGYPADRTKLDGLVLAMARSQRLEQKTSKPGRYGALGLQADDAGTEGPSRVELTDGQGQVLASLWVGRRRDRSATEAYFVRLDEDPVCWAASGALALDPKMETWVESTLVDIASGQVASVRITHPDGEQVLLGRPKDVDKNTPLSILNLPEGKEPQSEWVTARFASALQGLKLQDVKPAAAVTFPDAEAVHAEFWTTDNLHLMVESWEQDSLVYVRLRADHSMEGSRLAYEGPEVDGVPSIDLGGGGETSGGASKEEILAQADELNQRFAGWVYVLPTWKASALRGRMGELLKAEGDAGDPFANPGPGTGGAPTEHVIQVEGGDSEPEVPQPEASGPEAIEPEAPTTGPEQVTTPDPKPEGAPAPVFEIDADAVKGNKTPKADPVSPPE